MNLEMFRDLVISIFLVLSIVVLIAGFVLVLKLYLRLSRILDSIDVVVKRIRALSECITRVSKPVITMAAFIEGLRRGFKASGDKLKKKKKEAEK